MIVEILPNGKLRFLYDDSLRELMTLGKATVTRVSDVEPTEKGEWTADLSRVGGPLLGPFKFREEALTAEKEWLEANNFGESSYDLKAPSPVAAKGEDSV
jgi:hypothetical protein